MAQQDVALTNGHRFASVSKCILLQITQWSSLWDQEMDKLHSLRKVDKHFICSKFLIWTYICLLLMNEWMYSISLKQVTNEFITHALVDNKVEFVKLFIGRSIMKNYLTVARLSQLYNNEVVRLPQIIHKNLVNQIQTWDGVPPDPISLLRYS